MKVTIHIIMSYVLVLSLSLITGCASNTPRDSNEGTTSDNFNTNSSISSALISSVCSDISSTQSSETSSVQINIKENVSDLSDDTSSKVTSQEQSSFPTEFSQEKTSSTVSKITTSSESKKVNDSSNIIFKDESTKVAIKGGGWLPIREAYERGLIRIKIIDGLAHIVNNMNGVDYIQPANTDTGISYDGESPIIYTYEDGSTGTEKRDGAKYEYLPGMYNEIELPKDGVGRLLGSTCSICNKTVGQGYYPNSCEQFSRSQYCIYCGVYITEHTCHSCPPNTSTYYCSKCGKTEGDGKNGTCVQWLMGDVDCPNCGEHVAVRTCHTCTK